MFRLILTLEIKAFYPPFQLILSFINMPGECGEFSMFDVYALMLKRVLSVIVIVFIGGHWFALVCVCV